MRRIRFQLHGGRVAGVAGALVVAVALLLVVLMLLGLWIVLTGVVAAAVVATVVRTLFGRVPRDRVIDIASVEVRPPRPQRLTGPAKNKSPSRYP